MASYAELPQEEKLLPFATNIETNIERPRKWFTILLLKTIICLFAIWGVLDISKAATTSILHSPSALRPVLKDGYVRHPTAPQRSCRCGNTIAEALANDCKYDSHATAWLPPHCRDDELLEEWERSGRGPNGTWEYFADQSREHPLTVDEVAMLPLTDGFFWMTQEWHVMHCAFSWRKLLRAPVTGITLDRRTDGLHHIKHCEKNFVRRGDLQAIVTVAGVTLDADQGEDRNLPDTR